MNPTRTQLIHRLMILLILLAAFYRLDIPSLRGDKAATVLPLTDLGELSRVTDPYPPLYYALLHPWQWFLGDDDAIALYNWARIGT